MVEPVWQKREMRTRNPKCVQRRRGGRTRKPAVQAEVRGERGRQPEGGENPEQCEPRIQYVNEPKVHAGEGVKCEPGARKEVQ